MRAALLLFVACGGGDSATRYPFEDASGRSCVRTCTDDRCGTSCDVDPAPAAGCGADDPCWTISEEPVGALGETVFALCASCCAPEGGGIASTWVTADCVPFACETDDDCAAGPGRCTSGECVAASAE
jgi:hypothetical protein